MLLNHFFKKIVRFAVVFLCVVGVAACLDDEKLPFTAQLPYTSMEYPIEPGDTVLVKGNGFDGNESVRIEGNVSDGSGMGSVSMEWNAVIVDVSGSELRLVVPEEAENHCYVYLTHAGYEMELGSLTLGVSTGGDGGVPGGGSIGQYQGRVVSDIETDRGMYHFEYVEDRLRHVFFSGMEESEEFIFDNFSSREFIVVSNRRPDVVLRCRLDSKGLLEEILQSTGGSEVEVPYLYCLRDENGVNIQDSKNHIYYHWVKDGVYDRIGAYDEATGLELKRMSVRKDGAGVPNDVNIDLNALASFVFENELLNVLNMCGYLMPREERLVTEHNYTEGSTEEEQNASFSAAGYTYDSDHRGRVSRMDSQDWGSAKFWDRYMKVTYTD